MKTIIDYFENHQLLYWLLLIILIAITLVHLFTINVGFCTAWDEAYFLIKLKEAYEGSFITGKSQWNLLAIHWFPYLNLTNPIHSRIAIYLCELIGAVIATFTCAQVFGKRDILKYFTLSYLLFLQVDTTYAGESLNYVPMQALLLSSALCGVVLYWHSVKQTRIIWMIPTGIALGMAFFVIMPSSILLIGSIVLLLLLKKDWKAILSLVGGILLAVLYVHIFVCDLSQINKAMQFTATYFTKSGYRYSPWDIIVQLGLLARDGLLCLFICAGICFLSKKLYTHSISIAGIFMLLAILAYSHYQVRPQTSVSLIILSFIIVIATEAKDLRMGEGKIVEHVYSLLLISYPLIASIGTNTYIGSRMICFGIAWLFLFYDKIDTYNTTMQKLPFIAIICVLLVSHIAPTVNHIKANSSARFEKGNQDFAQLVLTDDQANYLNNVWDKMNEHGYVSDSSVVFTTEYDWSTVYAIDAKLSSNFYQKRNFLFFPKEDMLKPDFIFMCEWDKMEIGEALHKMPWGWPQEFDSVFIGSPEGKDFPWDADRWLYYRK